MLKIVTTPDAILGKKADSVSSFDDRLKKMLASMEEALLSTKDPIGVGLAAPQVGIPLRIFQMRPDEKSQVRSFINPEILSISNAINDDLRQSERLAKAKLEGKISPPKGKKILEGCLSIPNIWGYVQRKKELKLKYKDEKGDVLEETFSGFPAVIVQHEMDHLNGILFTKHVVEQNETLYRSSKDKDGKDIYDEIEV